MDKTMRKYLSIFPWAVKSYISILLPLTLLTIHILYINLPCSDLFTQCISNETFTEYLSAFTSLLGASFVLYSLNNNLNTVTETSLLHHYKKKLNTFPLRKPRSQKLEVNSLEQRETVSPLEITQHKKPATVEQLYRYLIMRLDEQNRKIMAARQEANDHISKAKSELHSLIGQERTRTVELQKIVRSISVGNVDLQVTGILLVFLGAYLSLY